MNNHRETINFDKLVGGTKRFVDEGKVLVKQQEKLVISQIAGSCP